MGLLTVGEAAKRVDRSERTIRRWLDDPNVDLRPFAGMVPIASLLEVDRAMRMRRGRPRKNDPTGLVLADVGAERARQDAKWGQQNHPDMLDSFNPLGELTETFPENGREARKMFVALATGYRALNDAAAHTGSLDWAGILLEEVYEALAEVDFARLRAELVQVAAVAAAWVEAIDRRES